MCFCGKIMYVCVIVIMIDKKRRPQNKKILKRVLKSFFFKESVCEWYVLILIFGKFFCQLKTITVRRS